MDKAQLVLKDDFERAINGNIWNTSKINPLSWEITGSPGDSEQSALKITINNSFRNPSDGKEIDRAEIAEKEEVLVPLGNSVWYLMSFYFPKDFLITNNRLVFAQWKQWAPHYGSPFLSVRYINNELSFKITGDEVNKRFNTKIDLRGKWHTLLVNYQLNSDQTGFVRAWLDNKPLLEYKGKMDYSPPPKYIFFKMGLYRDTIPEPQTVYFDKFRRGPTRESITN